MADWKSRATPVKTSWRERALPVDQKSPFTAELPDTSQTSTGEQSQTALEQAGDALLLGYLPQVQAGSRKLVDTLLPESMESGKSYVDLRDENIKRQQGMKEQNPRAATAGTVGALAATLPLPVPGLGSIKALKTAETAGVLGRIGMGAARGAVGGAGVGLLQNPGDVEGEVSPLQMGDRAEGAGIGGLLGGAGGGVIEGLAAVPAMGKGMLKTAYEKAFKVLGPYQRDAKLVGKDKIREIGKEALDSGLIGMKPKGYEALADKAKELKNVKGKEFGEMLDKIEEGVNKKAGIAKNGVMAKGQTPPKVGVSKQAIADKLREEMTDMSGAPGSKADNKKLESFLEEFLEGGSDTLDVKSAQKFKDAVKERANYKKLPGTETFEEKLNRKLYSKMKEGIEDAGDVAAESLDDPELLKKFKAVKKEYGNRAQAGKIAKERDLREFANRSVSLTDYKSAGAGATLGAVSALADGKDPGDVIMRGLGGAVIGSLGNKMGRRYGNQVLAKAFEKVGTKLESSPVFKNKVISTLSKLANDKPEAIANAIIQLSTDPEFEEKGLLQGGLLK